MYVDENCSYDPNDGAAELGALNPGHVTGGFFPEETASAVLEMELQHQHQHQQQLAYANWQYGQGQHGEPLLNLFHHFPACSPASSSLTFANSPSPSPLPYDPLLHLNLPPQPPLFGFSSLPGSFNGFPGLGAGEGDGVYGGMEFGRERGAERSGGGGRGAKHFTSERHRRDQMRDTYTILRALIPDPGKTDRASVVQDAINYIKELGRTVNELKILVEKKKRGGEESKRLKPEGDTAGAGDGEISNVKPEPEHYSQVRSSWLQRKSKDTEVDVRIIEDEVTIKLVQRKKINLLLAASRVIDGLQLDLRHVAGGHVGDTYSYLFNMKISEDSSLYASVIANKLIDVLNRQYTAVMPQAFSDGV